MDFAESELTKIASDNVFYDICYYTLGLILLSITESAHFVGRFGFSFCLMCTRIHAIVVLTTAVDVMFHAIILRGYVDKFCEWCRMKVVAYFLMLHPHTHGRVRVILQRMKLERGEEEEEGVMIGESLSFSFKDNGGCDFCSICWEKYKEQDKLTLVPKCKHYFHSHCFYHWLNSSYTCPMCRASVV